MDLATAWFNEQSSTTFPEYPLSSESVTKPIKGYWPIIDVTIMLNELLKYARESDLQEMFGYQNWQVYPNLVSYTATVSNRTEAMYELFDRLKYAILQTGQHTVINQVVDRFSRIPEVGAIYQDISDNSIIYYVFTTNDKYDDALMDTLITDEMDILDSYPQSSIFFRYIPFVLCDDPREVTGKAAQPIFQR